MRMMTIRRPEYVIHIGVNYASHIGHEGVGYRRYTNAVVLVFADVRCTRALLRLERTMNLLCH